MLLRDAWRALRAAPVVSIVAVLSLALGIGANTAIFSILDSLLIRTLPVREPNRLVQVFNGDSGSSVWTNPLWEQVRNRPELFDGAFAWSSTRFNLAPAGESEFVPGLWASAGMFRTLGVPALLGRTFAPADDTRGGGPDGAVAVIGYGFWQRRFGGAADVIGKTLTVERVPVTIVGVTPPDFFGPEVGTRFDVVLPLGAEPLVRKTDSFLDRRSTWWMSVMARLRSDQSIDQATAALRAVQPQIREATIPPNWRLEEQKSYMTDPFTLRPAATGTSDLRTRYRQPLGILMGVVGLVLLIACANIANLLLARATARRHEWSVRLALGASRWNVARQLLAESLTLSAAGALLGFGFAAWGSRLLVRQLSTQANSVFLDLSPDWRVFGFTTAVTVATALLFGVMPALRATRVPPMESLREQGRTIRGESRFTLSSTLVAAQIALSVVLIVGAALFMRTFASLATLNLGFDRDPVLVVGVNARGSSVEAAGRIDLYDRVREAAAALPGVAAASLSQITPVSGGAWNTMLDSHSGAGARPREIYVNSIAPDWFRTLGMTFAAGRDFDARDSAAGAPVVIINDAAARKFFAGKDPIGQAIQERGMPDETMPARTIVGVVKDAVYRNLREPVLPTMYMPLAQTPRPPSSITLLVRAAHGTPALLARPLADSLTRIDGTLTLTFRPLRDQIAASLLRERLLAMLSAFFGALALLLAALGLYGVMSYAVNRRRAEIGIRMALGATPSRIIRLVLSRVTLLVMAGGAAGVGLSLWLGKFVATLLFGLQPHDATTLAVASVTLAAVGLAAGAVPALRASKIDPTKVLREV